MEIINYEEKEMILLTGEEAKFYEEQEVCHICNEEFCNDENDRNKVRDHCLYTKKVRGADRSICNLRYKVPKEIPIMPQNAACDHHFIIKQLAEEFKGQFECLGENDEKYITFSVPINKKNNNGKTISYKLKFIDSFRFMLTSLLNLVDNLSEINKKECKACIKRKNIKSECDFIGFKNNILRYKCKECKKIWLKPINGLINGLIKKFPSVYQFCKVDLNKFVLLLRKNVYPYEYMDSWERFDETSLPDKKAFYNKLNEKGISNIDHAHRQKVWEVSEIKNLCEYHDLCVQSDTLLFADVFEKFRDMCIEIHGLDPAHFLSPLGLAWQACLKKT